jgi:hypothetical protein
MDSKYKVAYSRLYYMYRRYYRSRYYPPFGPDIIKLIKSTIDEYSEILREDAKYFLIVNFDHLILRPILISNYPHLTNEIRIEELMINIQDDIRTIILVSSKESEGEISGHSLMRTIDNLWRSLKTTNYRVWG